MSEPTELTFGDVLDAKLAQRTAVGLKEFVFVSAQRIDPQKFDDFVTVTRAGAFLSLAAELLTPGVAVDETRVAVRAVLDLMKLGRERRSEEVKAAMIGRSLASIHQFIKNNLPGFLPEFATYRDIYPDVANLVGPAVRRVTDSQLVEVKLAGKPVHTA